MNVWRVFPQHYRETAFTGAGGLYVASRWNHLGIPMVYTATSRALAALEFFVNLDLNMAPHDLLIGEATVPNELVEKLDEALLTSNWRELDSLPCRDLGVAWARSRRSLALLVPTAVVEGDTNLIINPAHVDFARLSIADPKPFHFDPRMFR
jgi:RES domain-containing protein